MTATQRTGNRCGHSPDAPRFCDMAKRGKGGQPTVIGRISSALKRSYWDRSVLETWQNMNPSGRKRRSCIREAAVSVGQFMTTKWLRLETRQCAASFGDYLVAPNLKHIARKISNSDEWSGDFRISIGRISTVLSEWEACGYITSTQKRSKKEDGTWQCSPSVRVFTKKFFIELGGDALWEAVWKEGARKMEAICTATETLGITIKEFIRPDLVVTPVIANKFQQGIKTYANGPLKKVNLKARAVGAPEEVRESEEYKRLFASKVIELSASHPTDGPRPNRWYAEEIKDNARRIADKFFNIAS